MKKNLNNNVIHFHGCKVKAPNDKFYASFKCFFHHFKSSAEAILLKEPPPAVKKHFLGTSFPDSKSFYIQQYYDSATWRHVCDLQVTSYR